MKISLLEDISKEELSDIKRMIGEAFVTNELFHEFGEIDKRREIVLKYMAIYTDYVYESKALYITEDRKGVIGYIHSKKAPLLPQLKMIYRLVRAIPIKTLKKFMGHIKQISNSNKLYSAKPHIDILFVCVDKDYQGKGYAKQLVEAAKEYDTNRKRFIPCFDDYYINSTRLILSNIKTPESVLDLGAGTGLLTYYWMKKL